MLFRSQKVWYNKEGTPIFTESEAGRLITLFGAFLHQLPDRQTMIEQIEPSLYHAWLDKHGHMHNELAARASLGGIFLLQHMGYREGLLYDANGRPFFADTGVDFSITHTDRAVFVALEVAPCESGTEGRPCRLGIDAEALSRIDHTRLAPLAERWFTQAEQNIFFADPTDASFLQIWTKKEALVKWLGEGLRGMRAADTVTACEDWGVAFAEYRVEDTAIALCYQAGANPPDAVRMLSGTELLFKS